MSQPMSENAALAKMRKAGKPNVRVTAAENSMCKIEVLEEGNWKDVTGNITSESANDMVKQAQNRTICG